MCGAKIRQEATARLGSLEFCRVFCLQLSRAFYWWAQLTSILERVLHGVLLAVAVLWGWGAVALMRGALVPWADDAPLGWLVISGLLWGLGGLIPVIVAVRAGGGHGQNVCRGLGTLVSSTTDLSWSCCP